MAQINLNFAGVEANSFGPLSEGLHSLKIVECVFLGARGGENGSKVKDPGIKLVFAPNVAPNDPLFTKKVYSYVGFGEKSMWRAKEFFEAVYQRPFTMDGFALDTDDLIGRIVMCDIEHVDTEYTNKGGKLVQAKNANITSYLPDTNEPVGVGIQ